ncbi:hypothetical protein SLV14_003059 [Streptomyces sp. Je 1-4]|uniref:hypothetical protein n=1 Tax=Streptomyces TaxID=1883 RepID=UPI0021DB356F|nr:MULTISPECIES: hypothetical protein [unclassified Streptomyces]UYB40438.1 hypothetical protein SLV14_003059 [Streptomyces sp. Je 1-4]UZQ36554.1 hypothetical protein SLV14N_003059 [Streptomyces sp. Je 1-4] [Streptomyces sp. Je 1-4 4N24]UZQ43971.1 hypothetical protein SLV14NA_003059 [Streptomyces sp. Je 1-4] [Streptomyces sp. Je 1-4 4N24_ara]
MSAVFVLPAAVRLPRTVAARRALLAGLFLVGFVALGFAFGPGAHADDRTRNVDLPGASAPARPAAEVSTPDRAATRDGASRISGSGSAVTQRGEASGAKVAERTHAASDAVAEAVRPAAERTTPVTGRITEPVSRVVREIGESAGAALPVHLPPGEHGEHPGDGGTDQHGRTPGEDRPAGSRTAGSADGTAAADTVQSLDDLRKPVSKGPSATAHEQRDPGHDGLPGHPQGPVAPAPHTAGDGHGPRGGDQHAAVTADPTRFRLLPGGVRTADGAPTRRRAEEILEFPG